MATFKFGRTIDIHWNGYEIVGPAETVFSIPDQLYEEFEGDLRPVEPSLVWIDTNEFQTLKDSVPTGTYVKAAIGQDPISVSTSSSTATISLNSGTALNGYLLAANGTGGTIWNPASTSGMTSVVGVSPVSTLISGGTVSVILNASYQTAGTYVTSVVGTSPVSASGTTAITVSVDQTAITANSATNAEVIRTYVKNASGSAMTKGQAVYVGGSDGTNVTIVLSSASSEITSSKTLGLLAQDLANNAFGYVIENGLLTGIDTSTATAGQTVWLGNTNGSRVYGAPPAEPSHAVYLGVVARSNANNGEILVKVQNGYELDELHDVSAGSPTDLDIIQYKSSSSLWTKSSIAGAGIAASVHTHPYQASGTYVNAVIGTSPASVSTASGTATVSISSGTSSSGSVLTSNGSGGATFAAPIISVNATTLTGSGTWTIPSGVQYLKSVLLCTGGQGGASGGVRVTTASGAAAGGASGNGGDATLYENIYVGDVASLSYSVGVGGAGASSIVVTKANGSATTTVSTSVTGSNGVASTLGPYLTSAGIVNGYGYGYRITLRASQAGAANSTSAGTPGSNNVSYVTVADFHGDIISYLHLLRSIQNLAATTYGAGAAGTAGTASSTIASSTATAAGGAAGDAGYFAVQSGGGGAGNDATGALGASAGGDGYRGGSGGGGGAGFSRAAADAASTVTVTGGNGGNGLDGTGCGGGGGGSVSIKNSNATGFTNINATATSGKGGNGGNGTIIIWW